MKVYDTYKGRTAYLYTLSSKNISVDICDFGTKINSLKVYGKDVVLGFDSIGEWLKSGSYAGATIGRCANRIGDGRFTMGGKNYVLNLNDGKNHLHGGNEGFDKKFFDVVNSTETSLVLTYQSSDNEENYPGNLSLTVTFTLDNDGLNIKYEALSDKDTLWNPTCHAYFTLNGEENENCLDNLLKINGDFYTPSDKGLIPTGDMVRVDDTPFDFRSAKPINFNFTDEALKDTNGYDHNYVLKSGSPAACVTGAKSGIKMEVYTDMPCMQFYSGGAIKPSMGKTHEYGQWSGFCLEPQYCPNAINMKDFDKPVIEAGEKKSHFIKYVFSHAD